MSNKKQLGVIPMNPSIPKQINPFALACLQKGKLKN